MRKLHVLMTAAILALAISPTFAADPAPATPTPAPASLSPAIQAALIDFSSDNFKTRSGATAKLQLALADQLRALTNSDDPEVLARLSEILEFNEGLSRWIIDTLKLPPDQRKAQLDFGMQPEVLPALALTFSSDPNKRIEGIKALAKIDKPQVSDILAPFLNDPDRAIHVAAMEAVFDRKPTDAIVDSLWDRLIGNAQLPDKKLAAADANLTFRGRPVGGSSFNSGFSYLQRRQDADLALETLINLKAPQAEKKIAAYLDNYDKAANGNGNAVANANGNARVNILVAGGGAGMINGVGTLYNPMGEPMKNVFKLIEAYKSKENIPVLYKIATEPLRNKAHGKMNNDTWFNSNRTTPLATLVVITGQKPEDYKLRQFNPNNVTWVFPSEDDESAAIKKLHDWYVANIDKNAPAIPDETPDDAPPQPLAPGHKILPIAPVQPGGPVGGNRVNSRRIGPIVEPGEAPATQP